MHIPDGYLSPSTCAVLYAGATPAFYLSIRNLKLRVQTDTLPRIALFAAFSFVLMLFNLPLPGGTTGHAVGVALAAVLLGPSGAIIAISLALFIQAVFFGDGGITTFGANCFNMAVVGSIVAAAIYRLLSWRAPGQSARHAWAAGLAGYVSINAAALCAAIEFGVQPALFHDSHGAPLYAPYPLRVAVPAMLAGHLTIAGLAEFAVTAGLVRYLQATASPLWPATAPTSAAGSQSPVRVTRLWLAISAVALLCPIGLLAVGTAWGEWDSHQLFEQLGRVPSGLRSLSAAYNAPLSDYDLSNFGLPRVAGYLVSALLGVFLIWFASRFLKRILRKPARNLTERTAYHLLQTVTASLYAESVMARPGWLQALDARVKLLGFAALLPATLFVTAPASLAVAVALTLLCAASSRVPLRPAFTRSAAAVLAFTGLLAIPAVFTTPGPPLFSIPLLGWTATATGMQTALRLTLRAELSTALALLLLLTTPWPRLLRALRSLHLPATAVATIAIAYRQLYRILQSALDTLEAGQARSPGRLSRRQQRHYTVSAIGALLDRTAQSSTELHHAMQARGFRTALIVLDDPPWKAADRAVLAAVLLLAIAIAYFGQR